MGTLAQNKQNYKPNTNAGKKNVIVDIVGMGEDIRSISTAENYATLLSNFVPGKGSEWNKRPGTLLVNTITGAGGNIIPNPDYSFMFEDGDSFQHFVIKNGIIYDKNSNECPWYESKEIFNYNLTDSGSKDISTKSTEFIIHDPTSTLSKYIKVDSLPSSLTNFNMEQTRTTFGNYAIWTIGHRILVFPLNGQWKGNANTATGFKPFIDSKTGLPQIENGTDNKYWLELTPENLNTAKYSQFGAAYSVNFLSSNPGYRNQIFVPNDVKNVLISQSTDGLPTNVIANEVKDNIVLFLSDVEALVGTMEMELDINVWFEDEFGRVYTLLNEKIERSTKNFIESTTVFDLFPNIKELSAKLRDMDSNVDSPDYVSGGVLQYLDSLQVSIELKGLFNTSEAKEGFVMPVSITDNGTNLIVNYVVNDDKSVEDHLVQLRPGVIAIAALEKYDEDLAEFKVIDREEIDIYGTDTEPHARETYTDSIIVSTEIWDRTTTDALYRVSIYYMTEDNIPQNIEVETASVESTDSSLFNGAQIEAPEEMEVYDYVVVLRGDEYTKVKLKNTNSNDTSVNEINFGEKWELLTGDNKQGIYKSAPNILKVIDGSATSISSKLNTTVDFSTSLPNHEIIRATSLSNTLGMVNNGKSFLDSTYALTIKDLSTGDVFFRFLKTKDPKTFLSAGQFVDYKLNFKYVDKGLDVVIEDGIVTPLGLLAIFTIGGQRRLWSNESIKDIEVSDGVFTFTLGVNVSKTEDSTQEVYIWDTLTELSMDDNSYELLNSNTYTVLRNKESGIVYTFGRTSVNTVPLSFGNDNRELSINIEDALVFTSYVENGTTTISTYAIAGDTATLATTYTFDKEVVLSAKSTNEPGDDIGRIDIFAVDVSGGVIEEYKLRSFDSDNNISKLLSIYNWETVENVEEIKDVQKLYLLGDGVLLSQIDGTDEYFAKFEGEGVGQLTTIYKVVEGKLIEVETTDTFTSQEIKLVAKNEFKYSAIDYLPINETDPTALDPISISVNTKNKEDYWVDYNGNSRRDILTRFGLEDSIVMNADKWGDTYVVFPSGYVYETIEWDRTTIDLSTTVTKDEWGFYDWDSNNHYVIAKGTGKKGSNYRHHTFKEYIPGQAEPILHDVASDGGKGNKTSDQINLLSTNLKTQSFDLSDLIAGLVDTTINYVDTEITYSARFGAIGQNYTTSVFTDSMFYNPTDIVNYNRRINAYESSWTVGYSENIDMDLFGSDEYTIDKYNELFDENDPKGGDNDNTKIFKQNVKVQPGTTYSNVLYSHAFSGAYLPVSIVGAGRRTNVTRNSIDNRTAIIGFGGYSIDGTNISLQMYAEMYNFSKITAGSQNHEGASATGVGSISMIQSGVSVTRQEYLELSQLEDSNMNGMTLFNTYKNILNGEEVVKDYYSEKDYVVKGAVYKDMNITLSVDYSNFAHNDKVSRFNLIKKALEEAPLFAPELVGTTLVDNTYSSMEISIGYAVPYDTSVYEVNISHIDKSATLDSNYFDYRVSGLRGNQQFNVITVGDPADREFNLNQDGIYIISAGETIRRVHSRDKNGLLYTISILNEDTIVQQIFEKQSVSGGTTKYKEVQGSPIITEGIIIPSGTVEESFTKPIIDIVDGEDVILLTSEQIIQGAGVEIGVEDSNIVWYFNQVATGSYDTNTIEALWANNSFMFILSPTTFYSYPKLDIFADSNIMSIDPFAKIEIDAFTLHNTRLTFNSVDLNSFKKNEQVLLLDTISEEETKVAFRNFIKTTLYKDLVSREIQDPDNPGETIVQNVEDYVSVINPNYEFGTFEFQYFVRDGVVSEPFEVVLPNLKVVSLNSKLHINYNVEFLVDTNSVSTRFQSTDANANIVFINHLSTQLTLMNGTYDENTETIEKPVARVIPSITAPSVFSVSKEGLNSSPSITIPYNETSPLNTGKIESSYTYNTDDGDPAQIYHFMAAVALEDIDVNEISTWLKKALNLTDLAETQYLKISDTTVNGTDSTTTVVIPDGRWKPFINYDTFIPPSNGRVAVISIAIPLNSPVWVDEETIEDATGGKGSKWIAPESFELLANYAKIKIIDITQDEEEVDTNISMQDRMLWIDSCEFAGSLLLASSDSIYVSQNGNPFYFPGYAVSLPSNLGDILSIFPFQGMLMVIFQKGYATFVPQTTDTTGVMYFGAPETSRELPTIVNKHCIAVNATTVDVVTTDGIYRIYQTDSSATGIPILNASLLSKQINTQLVEDINRAQDVRMFETLYQSIVKLTVTEYDEERNSKLVNKLYIFDYRKQFGVSKTQQKWYVWESDIFDIDQIVPFIFKESKGEIFFTRLSSAEMLRVGYSQLLNGAYISGHKDRAILVETDKDTNTDTWDGLVVKSILLTNALNATSIYDLKIKIIENRFNHWGFNQSFYRQYFLHDKKTGQYVDSSSKDNFYEVVNIQDDVSGKWVINYDPKARYEEFTAEGDNTLDLAAKFDTTSYKTVETYAKHDYVLNDKKHVGSGRTQQLKIKLLHDEDKPFTYIATSFIVKEKKHK